MSEQTQSKPWYRYPIVWLVVGIPLASVCAGIGYIYLAMTNPNDLIQDNYYKEGLAINKEFAEEDLAGKLKLEAKVSVDETHIRVEMKGTDEPYLKFNLFHFNDKSLDLTGGLAKVSGNKAHSVYQYELEKPISGHWYVEIQGSVGQKNWRLKGQLALPMTDTMTLLPMRR